jgi:diguanylate cyclase (GGDEF)-like protein
MFTLSRRLSPETISVLAGLTALATLAFCVMLLTPNSLISGDGWWAFDLIVAGFVLGSCATVLAVKPIYTRARKIAEREAQDAQGLAATDQMTTLLNRTGFFAAAEQAVTRSIEHGLSASLLYVDLDHFKELNDSYGHAAGDVLLKGVADRMRAACHENAVVGRLGGDEFAICIYDLVSMEEAEILACKLAVILAEPLTVLGHGIVPSASIGYALAPHDAGRIGDLARAADLALYAAKAAGRGHLT